MSRAEPVAIAAHRAGGIVASCASNLSDSVVGFSNFFATDDERESQLAAAVDETARFAPGLPVVGYERGAALERVLRLGFRAVGPLRVWLGANA